VDLRRIDKFEMKPELMKRRIGSVPKSMSRVNNMCVNTVLQDLWFANHKWSHSLASSYYLNDLHCKQTSMLQMIDRG
jgi:hypothetical protein